MGGRNLPLKTLMPVVVLKPTKKGEMGENLSFQ